LFVTWQYGETTIKAVITKRSEQIINGTGIVPNFAMIHVGQNWAKLRITAWDKNVLCYSELRL